jgi:predicted nucleic-acid-binding protein
MLAVDTNVLVRLAVLDNQKQLAAAKKFIESGAWVSHLVLIESVWVLGSFYSFTREQLRLFVETTILHPNLRVQDADVVEAALVHFDAQKKLSFTDCLVLEIARKAGHTPLGTFDKALGKLPGAKAL